MKKSMMLLAVSAILFATACGPKETKEAEATTENATEEVTEEVVEEESTNPEGFYGAVIDEVGAVSVDEFAQMMEGKDTVAVKIAAVAQDVCQNKGCWMKVQTADGKMMRIKFKDYGFFVPMDISGKDVVFEGIAFKDTVSVEDLKHYAKDGGQSDEEIAAITEPEINTSFLAHGVMIVQ